MAKKLLKMQTYINKINSEFDRLYEKNWVEATDDVCMRPLDYPVHYDPIHNILTIKPNPGLTLVRANGMIRLWKGNKYVPLKKEDLEYVNTIYELVVVMN